MTVHDLYSYSEYDMTIHVRISWNILEEDSSESRWLRARPYVGVRGLDYCFMTSPKWMSVMMFDRVGLKLIMKKKKIVELTTNVFSAIFRYRYRPLLFSSNKLSWSLWTAKVVFTVRILMTIEIAIYTNNLKIFTYLHFEWYIISISFIF